MSKQTALVVGASRTLGLGIARVYLDRGWDVIGTVRGTQSTALHDLADRAAGALEVEVMDMTVADQVRAVRDRLDGRTLDTVFVNAAIADADLPVAQVPTAVFVDVMVTNALAPMRVVEAFAPLVPAGGTIGVMSSTQGSISMNDNGGHEVYRASKSALNQLMRSYAARRAGDAVSLFLMDPGWVQTELGGDGATLTVDESAPGVVDTLLRHAGEPGLRFLDHRGATVPW
ncbi:SDR family oxidoreductase [Curtobacterium oceanosedimentum]|uniref:SDR family oxidoreductase n=1 Tax=Curtobacterium oceanosedimentum TaxID=465820 RepID=UPI001CE0D134|nr:SDR family oxidoreductase [Curtobacterium oceanosedimentum]MCA5924340.1 SDR family oxidoreductase [Curtobacterium oceanosedimentum]